MKILAFCISSFVLLSFSGCGGTSQANLTPKTQKAKKYPVKVVRVNKSSKMQKSPLVSFGQDISYLNKQSLIATMKNNIQEFSGKSLLQKMLVEAKFLQKDGNSITFNKYSDVVTNKDGLIIQNSNLTYDIELVFTGYYSQKKEKIYFIAIYDKKSSLLKGLYFSKAGEAFISQDLTTIGFYTSNKIKILKRSNKKLFSVTPQKSSFFTDFYIRQKLSKNGKYFAIVEFHRGSKENSLLVYRLDKKASLVSRIYTPQKYVYPVAEFSSDENFLIYTYQFGTNELKVSSDTKFTVYDIEKNKQVDRFGYSVRSKDDFYKFKYTNLSADRENFLVYESIEFSKEKNRKQIDKVYTYNISSKKVKSCNLKLASVDSMFLSNNDKVLHVIKTSSNKISRDAYLIEKDKCIFLKDTGYKKDNFTPIKITETEIDVIQKALKIKALYKAGFKKRADDKLKELILEHKHDLYDNNFRFLMANGFDKSDLYALTYQRYIRKGKTLENSLLRGTIKNYIAEESANGLKKHVKLMTEKYKELMGANPTQADKSRLAIYEAIYLLEIGKDDKAYDKLFGIETFSKGDIDFIKGYTFKNMALYKDPKKLSVITGIDMKHFSKLLPYQNNKEVSGYDLNGNFVKVGEKVLKSTQPQKTITPKQNAIKLLD